MGTNQLWQLDTRDPNYIKKFHIQQPIVCTSFQKFIHEDDEYFLLDYGKYYRIGYIDRKLFDYIMLKDRKFYKGDLPSGKIKGFCNITIKDPKIENKTESGLLFLFRNKIVIMSLTNNKQRVVNIQLKKKQIMLTSKHLFFWKFKGSQIFAINLSGFNMDGDLANKVYESTNKLYAVKMLSDNESMLIYDEDEYIKIMSYRKHDERPL